MNADHSRKTVLKLHGSPTKRRGYPFYARIIEMVPTRCLSGSGQKIRRLRIYLARSLRERTERGLQSAGVLDSEGGLEILQRGSVALSFRGINPAPLGPWFWRSTHTQLHAGCNHLEITPPRCRHGRQIVVFLFCGFHVISRPSHELGFLRPEFVVVSLC